MPKLLALLLLLIILPAGDLLDISASQKGRDPTFSAFWKRFRGAVVKSDRQAVASMTKFPFLFESRERSRDEFIKIQSQLFSRKIKKCFLTAKPVPEGEMYDVFCGELIFYFGKVDGEFKFFEFGVND